MGLRTLVLIYCLSVIGTAAWEKRHLYLATRPLIVRQPAGETVEYLSPDTVAIGHWALLVTTSGIYSPVWKPHLQRPLGTLFELLGDGNGSSLIKITTDFRPPLSEAWTYDHLGTTHLPDSALRNTSMPLEV